MNALLERTPYSVVMGAFANKTARISRAVVRTERDYDPAEGGRLHTTEFCSAMETKHEKQPTTCAAHFD